MRRVEGRLATFPHVSQENSLAPRARRPARRSGTSCTVEREGTDAAGMVLEMERSRLRLGLVLGSKSGGGEWEKVK